MNFYYGLESGSDKVLGMTQKGYTQKDISKAISTLFSVVQDIQRKLKIDLSVMVMPGLGGYRYWNEHVIDTAIVLNLLEPKWITFMPVEVDPTRPYTQEMDNMRRAGKNKELSDIEIVEQTVQIVEKLFFPTNVGLYGPDVVPIGAHPTPLGNQEIETTEDSLWVASEIRRQSMLVHNLPIYPF